MITLASGTTVGLSTGTNTIGSVSIVVGGTSISGTNGLPVSLASQPLPTGAATSANQVTMSSLLGSIATQTTGLAQDASVQTGNSSLLSIITNTARIPAKGQAASALSTPVVIASDQSAVDVAPEPTHHVGPSSGTITSSNTYQQVYAAGAIQKGAWFRAAFANQGVLYVDCGTVSSGGTLGLTAMPMVAGDYYALESPPLDAVNVYGTVAGDKFFSARY
jgi:hypothetical protein